MSDTKPRGLASNLIEMFRNGASEQEILEACGKVQSLDGPRYKCKLCLDSGMLHVVSASLLKHVHKHKSLAGFKKSRMDAVRCSCSLGDRREESQCAILRYAEYDFMPYPRGLTDENLAMSIQDFIAINSNPRAAGGVAWNY